MRAALLACGLASGLAAAANPPTNPFCGWDSAHGSFSTTLTCEAGVLDALPTALYGTPTGGCPGFAPSACNDAGFAAYARAACIGKASCTLNTSDRPDPCSGVVKTIGVVAHCSLPPGGVTPPPPSPPPAPSPAPQPPVSPTCALNFFPCPPPTWEPEYNLTRSTVIQPSSAGYFMPNHTWGLSQFSLARAALLHPAAHFPFLPPFLLCSPSQSRLTGQWRAACGSRATRATPRVRPLA